jgi:hypothetical protein
MFTFATKFSVFAPRLTLMKAQTKFGFLYYKNLGWIDHDGPAFALRNNS